MSWFTIKNLDITPDTWPTYYSVVMIQYDYCIMKHLNYTVIRFWSLMYWKLLTRSSEGFRSNTFLLDQIALHYVCYNRGEVKRIISGFMRRISELLEQIRFTKSQIKGFGPFGWNSVVRRCWIKWITSLQEKFNLQFIVNYS